MVETGKPQPRWATRFFSIWTAQIFSLVGSSVAGFALIWWLTETTGSATVLATATLISMLPGIVLGPFAGACVDRWNRRLVMIVADGFVALVSAWLAYLFWCGTIQPWHVYVIMFARSVGGTFHWPAMSASTSLMVPRQHLSRVAGLNQTLGGAVNIVAPPLGALVLALLPLHGVMAIDVVTAAIAIGPLFFVAIPQPARKAAPGGAPPAKTTLWQDMVEGFRYVWGWPGLRVLLFMAMVLNLVGNPAFTLIPILVTKHFHGQAAELGWMNSAWGIGLVAGGLILGAWGGFRRRIVTMMLGLVASGLVAVVIGLTPSTLFPLAVGAVLVSGVLNAMVNGPFYALMQTTVEPQMQGRVFNLVGSMCAAMSPLGMAIAGPVADAIGVGAWWVIDGIACTLMAVGGLFVPVLMSLEQNGYGQPSPAQAEAAAELT